MAKFNEKTTTEILTAMRLGTSFERAAQAAGVDRSTLWRWLKRGEKDESDGRRTRYAKFYREFTKADAEVVGRVEQNVVTMAEIDPRAAIWFLSKRAPLVYGNTGPAERLAMQRQMAGEFISFIEGRVSSPAYQEVLVALSKWGDTELDPKALPVPG